MIFNPIFIQDYSGSSQLKQSGLRFQSANYLFADIINVYENKSNVDNPQLSLEKSIGKNLFSLDGKDIIKVSAEELISFFETFPGKLDVIDSDKTLSDKSVPTISDNKNISVDDLLNQIELKGKIEIVSSEQPDKILLITINQIPEDKFDNKFLMNIKPNSSSIVSIGQIDEKINSSAFVSKNSEKSSNTVSELLKKLKLNYSRIKSEKKQNDEKDFAIVNSSEKQELLALVNQIADEIALDNSMKNSFLFSEIKEVLDEIKKELSMNTSLTLDETKEHAEGTPENDLVYVNGESSSKNSVENVFLDKSSIFDDATVKEKKKIGNDNFKKASSVEYVSINSETKEKVVITQPTIKNETLDIKKVSDGTEFQIQENENTSTDLKNNFAKTASKEGKYENGKVDDLGLEKNQIKEKPTDVDYKISGSNSLKSQTVEKRIFIQKKSEAVENEVAKNLKTISESETTIPRVKTTKSQQVDSKVPDVDLINVQLKEKLAEVKPKPNNKEAITKPPIEKGIVVENNNNVNEIPGKENGKLLTEIEINDPKIEIVNEKNVQGQIIKNELNVVRLKEQLAELDSKINIKNISKRNNESVISSSQIVSERRIIGESSTYKESKTDFDLSNSKSEVNFNENSPNEYSSKIEAIKTKIDLLIDKIKTQESPDSQINLSSASQKNQFDKGKVAEVTTKNSSISDFSKAKEAQKNSAFVNSDESKLKYSIHVIENPKVEKISQNNYKVTNNIPAGIKEVQIQKSFQEVNPNLSFSKKLFDSKSNYESKVKLERVSNDERQKIDSDLIIHEVENNESITSSNKNELAKSSASYGNLKSVTNIDVIDKADIFSKNSVQDGISNTNSFDNIDSKTFTEIPQAIEKEANITQEALSKNETLINNHEIKNNRKHVNETEDFHLSGNNKIENKVGKADVSERKNDQQSSSKDKDTSYLSMRNLSGTNEKPLDFIRDLKNNLENISDPLKNHPVEIIKNIREYELKNELKNLFNTNESKNITFKLSPENLGKVNIELDIKENLMQAKINVESESVKTLIQSSAGELKNLLMQNGIQLMSMSVSMNNADDKGHSKHAGKTKRRINDIDDANRYDEIQNNEQTKNLGYNTYDLIM